MEPNAFRPRTTKPQNKNKKMDYDEPRRQLYAVPLEPGV